MAYTVSGQKALSGKTYTAASIITSYIQLKTLYACSMLFVPQEAPKWEKNIKQKHTWEKSKQSRSSFLLKILLIFFIFIFVHKFLVSNVMQWCLGKSVVAQIVDHLKIKKKCIYNCNIFVYSSVAVGHLYQDDNNNNNKQKVLWPLDVQHCGLYANIFMQLTQQNNYKC